MCKKSIVRYLVRYHDNDGASSSYHHTIVIALHISIHQHRNIAVSSSHHSVIAPSTQISKVRCHDIELHVRGPIRIPYERHFTNACVCVLLGGWVDSMQVLCVIIIQLTQAEGCVFESQPRQT